LQRDGLRFDSANDGKICDLASKIGQLIDEQDWFSQIDEAIDFCRPVFDGDADSGLVQDGRLICYLEAYAESKRFTHAQKKQLIPKVFQLKDCLIDCLKPDAVIPKNAQFGFNALRSVAGVLDGPQVLHTDDDYDRPGQENTYLCVVALTDCQICVVKGSHKYESLDDFWSHGSLFSKAAVCDMTAGERLFLHVKTFHCGWGCVKSNTRLLYLLNVIHRDIQAKVLSEDIVNVFNGTAQFDHISTLHCKESNDAKRLKQANRFLPKCLKEQKSQCEESEFNVARNDQVNNLYNQMEALCRINGGDNGSDDGNESVVEVNAQEEEEKEEEKVYEEEEEDDEDEQWVPGPVKRSRYHK
jgi:hypothetical protein